MFFRPTPQFYQRALTEGAQLAAAGAAARARVAQQAAALGPYAHSAAASLQLREGMSAADAAAVGYEADAATETACRHGLARMTLRTGELVRGRELALATGDLGVLRDCAQICEALKQFPEVSGVGQAAGMV